MVAGCSGGSTDNAGDQSSIKVWILEDLPDRVKATQAIVDRFSQSAGVKVELVAVAEDQFTQLLTSSAAAGDLPDVVGGIPLPSVQTMAGNDLIDTDAVGAVVDGLDKATFASRALELTRSGDKQLAVPSDSWTQLLLYRTDLFKAAGLAAPTSYEAIKAAAEKLDSGGVAGFVGANTPGDAFTEQTFEHVALGNGCQLVDQGGAVTIDSDACRNAFSFYGDLVKNYSTRGNQDVDTTRASYFAGKAAMFVWSSYVLDELAGLRKDALPSCGPCKQDPAFLAKNTGVVTTIQGPDSSKPAGFGEVSSWTITKDSATDASSRFVRYMMSDGYVPWISMTPEGKVPVRTGTPEARTTYSDQWAKLPIGVDTKAPMSRFYGASILDALAKGPSELSRWGISTGHGDLIGALQGEHPVAEAVNQVTTGSDVRQAVSTLGKDVRSVQESLK
ncbi:ABC transporter substrate-binding protein [Tersicoccus sp. Bi-70]|uniref:ABC transporter substrate-binding protein n=1 Tax=Tersicoccus sp. Bi-70 TaxID=1897634 RepID=UPI001E3A0925|nr:extracellular solute-binding protein [Tersicoccus sp. Bi-70]